jgi:tetratricopeptide (TPR) repeat protein
MPHTKPQPRRSSADAHEAREPAAAWLTIAAFVLAAALVLARATMLETLRNPLDVQPGAEPVPRGPGAGTGLFLDLLGCVPALLVLARRLLDRTYLLRFAWTFVPMSLLAFWTVLSTVWAGDKFAAAVSGTHWLCACVLLWSAAQLVRDWAGLRLAAAVCAGLLLVQVGQGLYYRYVEHPELLREWEAHRETIIRQRGWDPDSFVARQFENRVRSGEMMGFTSSPNSYAAVLVLLMLVTMGAAVQRVADGDGAAWAAAPAATVVLAAAVVSFAGSRTAVATAVLGPAMLAAVAVFRPRLARHSRLAYAAGVALVLLGAAAVVGHGVRHGTLFHDSLTFRWRYWVAAAKLFAAHPLAGVGWDNFGAHYLAYRLPVAAEEIKDPHNFMVRFATELGAVGLALVVAWLLALWWDLTQHAAPATVAPATAEDDDQSKPVSVLGLLAAAGVVGLVIGSVAGIDWSQPASYNALEVMRRVGFLCLFVVGSALAAIRSSQRQELDLRPAPWVLYATLVGLGLFLLHNLVDFSLFEPGPMFLFAWLCGSALGTRHGGASGGRRTGRGVMLGVFAATVVAWVIAAGGFAVPVALAEGRADEGDEAVRTRRFGQAEASFGRALDSVPCNADYAFRAARAALSDPSRDSAERAIGLLDRAIALDPNRPQYWLHRAYGRLRAGPPDATAVRSDYERALRLDPHNVDVRLEYADVLRRFGDRGAAAQQYRDALRSNDLLSPDEPKRLPPKKLDEVRGALLELSAPGPP